LPDGQWARIQPLLLILAAASRPSRTTVGVIEYPIIWQDALGTFESLKDDLEASPPLQR
jgi:hypothetical protein